MGAWGPVPCRLGPLPEPLGRLPGGGPDPTCESQTLPSPLDFRIEIYVDFDVDFGSFWGRSWVPLGGHFRSFWCLFRPKLVPEPSSNHLIFEKVIVHETIRFIRVWGVFSSKMAPQDGPRSPQDGSKIVLDRFFFVLIFRLNF